MTHSRRRAGEIARAFGFGWWARDTAAATELLEKAGFRRQGNQWLQPDGRPFSIRLMVEGEARPVMTRAGSMIAQQWRQFGIDAATVVADAAFETRRIAGDFEVTMAWSVETWGGHQDLSFFLDSWHSQFVARAGSGQPPRNWQRWSSPSLDRIIDDIRTIDFDDERGLDLGRPGAREDLLVLQVVVEVLTPRRDRRASRWRPESTSCVAPTLRS